METDREVTELETARAHKRRETLARIAETGLKLFMENGYEETTLDAIAAASGISRRTFFHYFTSKDDILLAYQKNAFLDAIPAATQRQSPDQSPIDVARNCLLDLASKHETKESMAADRLLRSTEALRKRKEAMFVEAEQILTEALQRLWPDPARYEALRVVAMMAVGTLRLAMENARKANGEYPLARYLREGFDRLKQAI